MKCSQKKIMRENRKEKKGRRQRGELEVRKGDRLGGRSKR